ncbi:hypothetical protein ACQJBY_030655 [Aegilops geniculata]
MGELLGEAAAAGRSDFAADGNGAGSATPERSSQDSLQLSTHHDVAMDLINSVTGVDEEGRSRQRILTFAAKRYISAIERNPEDPDAYYNWALVLQESADNVDPNSDSSKDSLLEEACKKYAEATRLCPTLYDAYYNWAIAIADRAKMRGRTKEAEELWQQAIRNYDKAVQLSWNSPQALNNWGLGLQELSAIVPAKDKQTIIKTAIKDTSRSGGADTSPNDLYSQSAIYVAAAHALKPNYSVYRSALRLVRSMLPLPYLKVGYLTAPPADDPIAPHKHWERSQFILNHTELQQVNDSESAPVKANALVEKAKRFIKVDVADIVSVSTCSDLTLPPGAGLCINTTHGPVFLVADTWESLDCWLDAIRLVYTIFARGKTDVLAGIITG